MDDDRSALNRYRRKLDQIRSIRESGGHREHEDTLRHEINGLWDQMTEDEKAAVNKDRAKEMPMHLPETSIQEVPVDESRRQESKKPALPKKSGPWNLN